MVLDKIMFLYSKEADHLHSHVPYTACVTIILNWQTYAVLHIRPKSVMPFIYSSVLFYTSSTLIAAPVWTRPSSQPVRMFVVFWLLYSIVVSVAYQVGANHSLLRRCAVCKLSYLHSSCLLLLNSASLWRCSSNSCGLRTGGGIFNKYDFWSFSKNSKNSLHVPVVVKKGKNKGFSMNAHFDCLKRLVASLSLRVRTQAVPCKICGWRSGMSRNFFSEYFGVFLVSVIPSVLYTHACTTDAI